MAGRKPLRLPAQPLLDRIARNGGLDAVMDARGIPTGDPTRHAGSSAEYDMYSKRLERAEKDGYLTFFTADAMCIELLDVHPLFVFGDHDYFNPIDPNVEAEAETSDHELTELMAA